MVEKDLTFQAETEKIHEWEKQTIGTVKQTPT
jgi:hypothetical protein